MVFVHARNATVKTALALREIAKQQGDILDFQCEQDNFKYGNIQKRVSLGAHFLTIFFRTLYIWTLFRDFGKPLEYH